MSCQQVKQEALSKATKLLSGFCLSPCKFRWGSPTMEYYSDGILFSIKKKWFVMP